MKKMQTKFFLLLLFFTIGSSLNGQMEFIDPEDLQDAVNSSTNGGTFIVSDGTYSDFEASFKVTASESNPVIIRSETVGGVTLNGESHFVLKQSAYVTIEGFVFDGQGEDSLIKLEGSNHIRITRNVFELETTESIKWVFIGGVWNDNTFPFQYPSHHNRIDHNVFKNKETPGHYITVDGSFDDSGSEEVYYQSQYDTIDYNYFKNNGPRAVNEQESIRIGWSEMSASSGYTLVENNLFEDCDGDPEIISVKSSDNIIRRNTFRNSYGSLVLRHGNRNRVEGNYFFGNDKAIGTSPAGSSLYTGGIRIYGTDHVIINNYLEGLNGTRWDAPITLTLGDAIDGESSNLSKHFRAERVLIAYNTLVNNSHGIEIGYDNNNNYNKDLEDITIANNLLTGSENSLVEIVDTDNDQGNNISWSNNLMFPIDNAEILSGASLTTFDMSEVQNIDPSLVFDAVGMVWKASEDSPLLENAVLQETVSEDIEGHDRPNLSNPGADHFSLESPLYGPLSPEDVGTGAYVDLNTSINEISEFVQSSVFPVPVDNRLHLEIINGDIDRVQLIGLDGRMFISDKIENGTRDFILDTASLINGIYLIQLYKNGQLLESKKLIVQH